MNHFRMVVYIPAQVAAAFSEESLKREYDFIDEFIGLDKVYLETHRGECDVDERQIGMIKSFLESRGVEVSGGITATIPDFEGAEAGKQRLFDTFCYTDPAMRKRMQEIAEYTAGLFDEVILDDFFFTNCTCERCIRAKDNRDWVSFRRDLMKDVSENLVVKPAKRINPKIRVIIKYPNWRESYHFTGYVPEVQRDIFDATYTGTETRSPRYTDQHLPEYLSYSLVRYMENAWPGRNGGGWFDTYECWSVDRYLEQAYLTAFAKAGELMHFQWHDLIDNPFVTAMKLQIGKIDKLLEGSGRPTGLPVYIPFASSGENHLEMRLGMLGIPIDPTPFFPEVSAGKPAQAPSQVTMCVSAQMQTQLPVQIPARMLLTESALADKDVVTKLESYVRSGGTAIITTGFLREAGDALRNCGLTEARLTGRSRGVTRYHVTGDRAGYYEHQTPILFPEIVHGNNDSWSLLNGGDGDLHTPLVLRSSYGRGRLYIIAIPEQDTDLYKMPDQALDVLRHVLTGFGTDASGKNISLFTYDDGSMILYRYVKDELRPGKVTIHCAEKARTMAATAAGEGADGPLDNITIGEAAAGAREVTATGEAAAGAREVTATGEAAAGAHEKTATGEAVAETFEGTQTVDAAQGKLVDITTGETFPVQQETIYEDFEEHTDYSAAVTIAPGQFRKLVWM